MGLISPNWYGIARTFARGPHSNCPGDPQYWRHWEAVEGSPGRPTDAIVLGTYDPPRGSRRARIPANARFSGDKVFIDRANLPEPAIGLLKPAAWGAKHRTIDPVAIPKSEVALGTDRNGQRVLIIPEQYGGGRIVERPSAIRGRANNTSAGKQARALLGLFSNPRWRR